MKVMSYYGLIFDPTSACPHLEVPQIAGRIRCDSICTALMYFILARATSVSLPRGPMVSQISRYRSSVFSGLVARWYSRNEAVDPGQSKSFSYSFLMTSPTCCIYPSCDGVHRHDERDGGVFATRCVQFGNHSLTVFSQVGHGL